MACAEASVVVDAIVSEVFQFVLDGENNKLWRPRVQDVKRKSDDQVGVGTIFIQGIGGPNFIRINADYKIIECNEDKRISFQVLNGPFLPIGTIVFQQLEKRTKITFSMDDKNPVNDPTTDLHLQNVVNDVKNLKSCFKIKDSLNEN